MPPDALNERTRVVDRGLAPLPGTRQGTGGTSTGVNVAPGEDDDGWTVPPPAQLADGTSVQLYKDGEALHAAYHAIEAARTRIWGEVYIFHSDRTGRAFADLFARRAREGLDVRILYDSIGSTDTDPQMFRTMRDGGVRLREFHPWKPWCCAHGWRPFNRDHRKLLVADGDVAVLGGQNVGDEYAGSWVSGEPCPDARRDTGVGLRGPSVRLLSAAYARVWDYAQRGGPVRRAELFHSAASYRDDPRGGLLEGEPDRRTTEPSRLGAARSRLDVEQNSSGVLASAPAPRSPLVPALQKLLRDARASIDLTMAYFAPPEELVEQLVRSARGGVRVRLMLPGRTDVPLLHVAARAFYERLLAAGVEIYERQHAVLHAKTLCVDGRISIIGSTNLDYRSIQFNCELSEVIHSAEFGRHMHELFGHDVRYALRIVPEAWRHRPRRDRLVQWAVMRARYLL